MAWIVAWLLLRHLRSGAEIDWHVARFWIGLFALTFVMGVATGIPLELQFGTNWARYARFVGDVFGAPLAAEGILAFFLESTFLGVLLFGAGRVSRRCYFASALLVAVGSTLSGLWIIIANSWQQTPTGYAIINGRAELIDFRAAALNPSTIPRFLHAIDGALITGSLFVLGLSAWLLLRGRHVELARRSAPVALVLGLLASVAQWPLGHYHAVQVAQTQPAKLAAFEGLWETQRNAPLLVFGIPDVTRERTDHAIGLPGLLSLGVGGTTDTVVTGLRDIPPSERPPVLVPFAAFHVMVGLGAYFVALNGLGLLLWWRRRLWQTRWFLWVAALSLPLPVVANELGWIAAEVGRQPWIVQGLLRVEEGCSERLPAGQVLASIVMFALVYALLFVVWIKLIRKKLWRGPEVDLGAAPARQGSP
jgi:cytochrome d ubiquinol oxidase subunit I